MVNRALIYSIIFSFFCVQIFPLPAVENLGKEVSSLPHPAAKLIGKKLDKLLNLKLDAKNSKNIDKVVKIIVDLKFDLWNLYRIHVCTSHALEKIKKHLKEQDIEDAKKYLNSLKKKLDIAIKIRYAEEEKNNKATHILYEKFNEVFEYDQGIYLLNEDNELKKFDLINHYVTGYTTHEDGRKRYDNCPPSLEFWVTVGLVGVFVLALPVPGAVSVGSGIFSYSINKCSESILQAKDQEFYQKKAKEKGYDDCSICEEKNCPYHEERMKARTREKKQK